MIKKLFLLTPLFFLFSISLFAKTEEKVSRIVYYKNLFGHIHKNSSRYSQSLSTIGCGHPIKILKDDKNQEIESGEFFKVLVGPYNGYIAKKYLSSSKVECFADRFPAFFDNISLELTDMYYWGKLYDQYIYGRSKVQ